jgi:hypothetical protein
MGLDIQNLPGTAFNADHRVYSNFFADNHIIQNVSIVQPKNLLIDILRKYFSQDNIYTYRADDYGFPATPDLTGKTIDDPSTTKILISDVYRYEIKFYPAITVKTGNGNYVPLGFNQNYSIKYRKDIIESDFGYTKEVLTPTHKVYAGVWEMNFDVTIYSESHSELEEITEITSLILQYSAWNELRANGLFIKSLSIGSESAEPYANDFVFSHTISLSTRSEWRVEIPLENIVEKIVFYFDVNRTPIPNEKDISDVQALKFEDVIEIAEIKL